MKKNKAVFIDRDGTIIKDKNYLFKSNHIEWYAHVFEALKILARSGYKVIMVTNQSGIGRRFFTDKQLQCVHRAIKSDIKHHGAVLDAIYYCPHVPEKHCLCRKPNIGLIKRAEKKYRIDLSRSYMIGDKAIDIETARRFGGTGVLVLSGKGMRERKKISNFWGHVTSTCPQNIHITSTFYSAVKWITRQADSISGDA